MGRVPSLPAKRNNKKGEKKSCKKTKKKIHVGAGLKSAQKGINIKSYVGGALLGAPYYNGISKNGITLISLVITIIIILILSGVGITGSLSLIEQARYTAFINEMKQINEAVLMQIYERQIESASNGQPYEPFPIEYKVTKEEFERLPESLKYEVLYIRELLKEEDIGEKLPTKQYYNAETLDLTGMYYVDESSAGGKVKTYIYDEQSASSYKVEPTEIWGVEMHGYEYGELLVSKPGLLQKAQSSNKDVYPEVRLEKQVNTANNTVDIIVTTQEKENGIIRIELLNNGEKEEYSSEKGEITKTFTVDENAKYQVKVTTAKEVHLIETIEVTEIGPTAPTLEIVEGEEGTNNWYKTTVKIKVTQGETKQGNNIGKTTYTITNTKTGEITVEETTIENNGTIEITEDGEYKIIAYTYDTAGNKSVGAELEVKKDQTAPVNVTLTTSMVSSITESGFTINITTTDATSNIDRYEYYVNNTRYTTKTITNLSEGTTYPVYVKVYDKAGNVLTTNTISIATESGKISISGGSQHSLAIDSSGNLWAWGANGNGQVGNGTTETQISPVQIKSGTKFSKIVAGGSHSLGIDENGNLWGWGSSSSGRLGDGNTSTTIYKTPIQIKSGTKFSQVSGSQHSLAIDSSGNLWAWGFNGNGQVGNGTTETQISPVQIKSGTKFSKIVAGSSHSLGIDENGNLWGWGHGGSGKLATSAAINYTTPIQIKSGTKFKKISSKGSHNLAIDESGNLWAWGANNYGQIGNSTTSTTGQLSVVQIKSGTKFKEIAAGNGHSLAIDESGNLWTWGYNNCGQLGTGNTTNQTSPIQIKNGTKFSQISAGQYHSLAIDESGNLWAWGYNNYGQLGNGTTSTTGQLTPVKIKSGTLFK